MAPKKKVTGLIKLQINAGAANPAPPIGPALGQHGVNIMEFCKAYNAATESQRGQRHPRGDHRLRGPQLHVRPEDPACRGAHQEGRRRPQGLRDPHTVKVAKITKDQVRQIAETKQADLNANDIEAAISIIAGTARSMGITVEG